MMWLRTHLPVDPSSAGLWGNLAEVGENEGTAGALTGLAAGLATDAPTSSPGGLWASLGDNSDSAP
ncbi:unannotated protein [freshwater metagenome]